jgi:hypothetical protein
LKESPDPGIIKVYHETNLKNERENLSSKKIGL